LAALRENFAPMESVAHFLQACRLGKKQAFRMLSIFPIMFPGIIDPYPLTLDQAIDSGVLVVTEVDASDMVLFDQVPNVAP
jgi:hypothetical protein